MAAPASAWRDSPPAWSWTADLQSPFPGGSSSSSPGPSFSDIPGDPRLEESPFQSQASLGSECTTPSRLSWLQQIWFQEMLLPACLPGDTVLARDTLLQRDWDMVCPFWTASLQKAWSKGSSAQHTACEQKSPLLG